MRDGLPHGLLVFIAVIAATLALMRPAHVGAVALIPATGANPTTDLENQPDNFVAFDGPVITWKMSDLFRLVFDDPRLRGQVRLAMEEWEDASSDFERRASPRYAWTRYNGQRSFSDLQSVVIHEVGHALGAQHPDASWFNANRMLNFRPDGSGGWEPAAPFGGEIMNEGNIPDTLPGTKPMKGIKGGEYWRTLSKDELDFLDHSYGQQLDFQEVGPDDDADIIITIRNLFGPPDNNLGSAGPDGSTFKDPGNPLAGAFIDQSTVMINAMANTPIGMQARMSAWEITNESGQGVEALSIRVEGTSQRQAIETSSVGNRRFTTYEPSPAFGLFELENRGHRFLDPVEGSVPDGGSVQVGLRVDVWDWFSTGANFRTTSDDIVPANLVSIIPFINQGQELTVEFPDPPDLPSGLSSVPGIFEVLNTGVRLINAEADSIITELAFAPVAGLDLGLEDLIGETLRDLAAADLLQLFSLRDPIVLGPGDEFVIVFDGMREDLPQDLLEVGNFLMLDLPDLFDGEFLAYALSSGDHSTVGSYSLINTPPIVGRTDVARVSAPVGVAVFAIFAVLVGWPSRRPNGCIMTRQGQQPPA